MTTQLTLQFVAGLLAADPLSDESFVAETEPSLLVPSLLLAAFMLVGIAAVWGGLYLAMRWRKAQAQTAPARRTLIDRLASLHAIPADDVLRLKSLAADLSLADPAMLCIDPRFLEACAAEPATGEWALSLGRKLFGTAFQESTATANDATVGVA